MNQASNNEADLREEERLEAQLEHLKELHLKLRSLRTTIPRMIEPLTRKHALPEELFTSFGKSVATAQRELVETRAAITSEETKKILDESTANRQARPKGIRPWRASDDPDWTMPKKRRHDDR